MGRRRGVRTMSRVSVPQLFCSLLCFVIAVETATRTCDSIATDISTKYSQPTCSSFAEQSANYRRVSVEASSWCHEGRPCRAQLHHDVSQFREQNCNMRSTAATQAAARAILNVESCGLNGEGSYCGELSSDLYKFANEQLAMEASGGVTKVNCNDLQNQGDLSRLGCCVATFSVTLTDMQSSAATMWRAMRDLCSDTIPAVAETCPLLADDARNAGGKLMPNVYNLVITVSIIAAVLPRSA